MEAQQSDIVDFLSGLPNANDMTYRQLNQQAKKRFRDQFTDNQIMHHVIQFMDLKVQKQRSSRK